MATKFSRYDLDLGPAGSLLGVNWHPGSVIQEYGSESNIYEPGTQLNIKTVFAKLDRKQTIPIGYCTL